MKGVLSSHYKKKLQIATCNLPREWGPSMWLTGRHVSLATCGQRGRSGCCKMCILQRGHVPTCGPRGLTTSLTCQRRGPNPRGLLSTWPQSAMWFETTWPTMATWLRTTWPAVAMWS
jgi:hypothetical protein